MGVKAFLTNSRVAAAAIGIAALTFAPAVSADPVVNVKPQSDVSVALHKALYSFKMVSVQSGAGISGISGTMYYEQDDNCDAWTTDHRFRVEYQYPERRAVANTSHYVAFESKDQAQFYFSSERQEDGQMTEQLRGSIDKNPDGTAKADYSRPDDLSYTLPKGYLLPTQHTNELIRRARAGEKFFDAVIFDGTDADGPVEINAHIGKKLTADEIKAAGGDKVDRSLLSPEAWHVRMAVFPLKERDGMTPSYEMDINMHDNGIISYSLVDYKSFKVEQKLVALEKIPAKACPKN